MKKTITYLIIFLTIIATALAQGVGEPPFFAEDPNTAELITIHIPSKNYLEKGTDFDFHIHTYLNTGQILWNNQTDCWLHLYDPFGNHLMQTTFSNEANIVDKIAYINGSVYLEQLGEHPWIVWCASNSNYTGDPTAYGTIRGKYTISNTGTEHDYGTLEQWILTIIILGAIYWLLYKKNRFIANLLYMIIGIIMLTSIKTDFVKMQGMFFTFISMISLLYDLFRKRGIAN